MSSPYDAYGYERLREHALNTFTYVALINDVGNEETRINVETDSRLINSPDYTTDPLEYQFKILGEDSDISLPVTITETRLYETASATTPVGTDTMKDATLEAPGDEVTISHEQHFPQ